MSRLRIKHREWRKLVAGLRSRVAAEEIADNLRMRDPRAKLRVVIARERRGWDVEIREGRDAPRHRPLAIPDDATSPASEKAAEAE